MKLSILIGIYFTRIPFLIAVSSMSSINYLNIISKCSTPEIILYFVGIIYLYVNRVVHSKTFLEYVEED